MQLDPKDGTFSLTFTLPPPPPQDDDARPLTGTVQTLYEPATRNHYLSVRCGALVGRVSLMDGSKSAWQANVGDDLEATARSVSALVERVDRAARGDFSAPAPPPRGPAPPLSPFPFPDQVRPVEG